jgi:hypothetical protein
VVVYGMSSNESTLPTLWLMRNSITLRLFLVYDLSAADRVACLAELSALLQSNRLIHTVGRRLAAMSSHPLVLKRASVSRSSGEWSTDDYDVVCEGLVGRIMKAAAAPEASPWTARRRTVTPPRARPLWLTSRRAGCESRGPHGENTDQQATEAKRIERGLEDPAIRALVIVVEALAPFAPDVRRRVLA